jgi:hypothetical protein
MDMQPDDATATGQNRCLGKRKKHQPGKGGSQCKSQPRRLAGKNGRKHQDNPKGEAAVMTVGDLRERTRVCNLAAERRQKRKERFLGNVVSRRGDQISPTFWYRQETQESGGIAIQLTFWYRVCTSRSQTEASSVHFVLVGHQT